MRGRVTDQAIGRRQRIDDDLRNEIRAVTFQRVQFEILDIAFDALLDRQIILRARLEKGIEPPCRVHEALVLGIGGQIGLTGHDLDHILAEIPRGLERLVRIGRRLAQHQPDRANKILPRKPGQRPERHGSIIGGIKGPCHPAKRCTLFRLLRACLFFRPLVSFCSHVSLLFPDERLHGLRPTSIEVKA